ncbi:MAG TPA: PorV/PorQ family protein [Elusimicrobiota bacterium]|nr:PorV/PorQ family protein [Elusimicrobiota bacterium]
MKKLGLDMRMVLKAGWGLMAALILQGTLLSVSGWAKGPGTSTANFLKIGVGGRAVAMGEAQTAATEDTTALYWNPAGLDRLDRNEIVFSHNQHFLGLTQDVLALGVPTAAGTFGAGMSLVRVGDVAGYDNNGLSTEKLQVSDALYTLGWGKRLSFTLLRSDLYTGINVKFLQKKLDQNTASAVFGDVGFVFESQKSWMKGLRSGLVFENIGSSGLTFEKEVSPLPSRTKFGLAYPMFGNSMVLSADAVKPCDNDLFMNFGAEYRLFNTLSFRLGYKGQNDFGNGLSYGMGIGNKDIRMDYAFVAFGDLGNTHRVSISYRFGQKSISNDTEVRVEKSYQEAELAYAQGYIVDAYMQASNILDVAPWHQASKDLIKRVQKEFKELESLARKDEFQKQIQMAYERGVQHFQNDALIEAKKEFELILSLVPDHEAANEYLKRIADRFRSVAQNFYDVGNRYFSAGNYDEAAEYFQKVLVLDPQNLQAQEMLDKSKSLKVQAAEEMKDRAIQETIQEKFRTAMKEFEKKRYETALEKFEEVLRLNPNYGEAKKYRSLCQDMMAQQHYETGLKAMQNSKWDEAIASFRRALQLKPSYPEVSQLLQKILSRVGEDRKVESSKLYKQGLEALLVGDKEKALKLWQKAAEMNPDNLDAKRGLERLGGRK